VEVFERMSYCCTTCDAQFESVPSDAVLLSSGNGGRIKTFRFADGTMHHIRKFIDSKSGGHGSHNRWHRDRGQFDPTCRFCNPRPVVESKIELQEVATPVEPVEAQVVEPTVEPVIEVTQPPEPEIEQAELEPENITAMAAAFRNSWRHEK
jgi:hypothetical protein